MVLRWGLLWHGFSRRRRLPDPGSGKSTPAMLTVLPQQCGMTNGGAPEPSRSCWRTPMADKSNDPVAIWQNMIGEMEKGFNSFANKAMESPQFSKVVNQVGRVTAGAQQQLGELT